MKIYTYQVCGHKELPDKAKEEYEKAMERSKVAYEAAVKHLKGSEISDK